MSFSFLDFIFPKKCAGCSRVGEYFCADCHKKIEFVDAPICPVCQRRVVGGKTHPGCSGRYRLDGLVVACRYRDPVKVAIKKVKYRWVYDIEKVLVDLLTSQIWRFDIPQNAILVPVPLHKKRKNWRGFNQSEILAKNLANQFKVEYSDLLIRNRETKTQVGLSRDDRKKNVKGAFSLSPSVILSPALRDEGSIIRGRDIMLVDDVFTSGATMAECAKVLKRAGVRNVWSMVVALG